MPPTKRRRSASPLPGGGGGASAKKPTTTSSRPSTSSNRQWKQWKQQQSHDYNTHQFLDASATVHAGLFGARRLPEIKSLWRQMVQGELNALNEEKRDGVSTGGTDREATRRVGESGGGKISSRHLRRRTNSHKPRRRYRFQQGNKLDSAGDADEDAGAGAGASTKEYAEQDAEVKVDGTKDVNKAGDGAGDRQNKQKTKTPCRRARRKPSLLRKSHSHWWQQKTNTQLLQDSSKEAHTHHWVPTHMWHAKRFHMSPRLFSWCIPLLHTNRGSRASLRLASSKTMPKCTIQDATWEVNGCAIKLGISGDTRQSSVHTLSSFLHRICGGDAQFLREEAVLSGQRAGECLVHELDACPLQPIGPASFIFGRSSDDSDEHYVLVQTHPSIHQKIVSLLNNVIKSYDDSDESVALSTVPLALLRIRGRASASTLRQVLDYIGDMSSIDDANHGDLFVVEAPTSESKPLPVDQSTLILKCHQPNQNYQHLPHNLASSGWDVVCHPCLVSSLFQSFVILGGACAIGLLEDARAQLESYPPLPIFPRDYPDTEEGKSYWQGSAGVSHLSEGSDTNDNLPSATWKDWAVIRACVEGSWGRNNTTLKRTMRNRKQHDDLELRKSSTAVPDASSSEESLEPKLVTIKSLFGRDVASVHWGALISPDETSTIVVRGSFGVPFLQLLHGCGCLKNPTSESDTGKAHTRRPRRKVRTPSSSARASPLSKSDSDAHSSLCEQLSASLSLPALLRCELSCDGKGRLNVGDLIFPFSLKHSAVRSDVDSDLEDDTSNAEMPLTAPLGVVTAGGFSPSRGKCHGLGFVGAAKLIDALNGTTQGMGVLVPQTDGKRKMVLKVAVVRSVPGTGCDRHAMLSILL